MKKLLLKEVLGWGVLLWFVGYILGIALFFVVPSEKIGWFMTPIGVLLTLWVLLKKINRPTFSDYLIIALGWTIIAIVLDYIFMVLLIHPADGYYKWDVYLYYALTFALPIIVGSTRRSNQSN